MLHGTKLRTRTELAHGGRFWYSFLVGFYIVCDFGPIAKGPSLQVAGLHTSESDD